MSATKQLLTYREVVEILGVCRKTIERRVRQGLLKAVSIGSRNVRFRRRDVDRIVEKGWKKRKEKSDD